MDHLSPLEQVGLRLLRLHDLVYKKSGGRIGHRIPGAPPSLLLHTTGAKTGIARSNTLTYAEDGGKYYIVASLGGAPKAPGWYHNLKANPQVEINLGTRRLTATARPILPDDPDYARLWRIVNDNNSGRYDAYQKRTTRPIPIVELTP
ncbi:nitroreductase family deazaflavin-dependent oxidoreductase [Mycolicibacterium sp. S2-37]|uniref:nitroreductase family deazaflavin-dependent oxidoreductase n=1 Tax=Mycolicibacterium sp. S2-37 TaxID=2810297 RepID=UPI001A94D9FD|nr:nitroreductase family deazaflavin-dependent oxidoreductase [Mycolicibacterium sp. S2-37]MBO0679666.1 nitroreductase family deazaflavin-dependent oxidoreductase [Mycolicibacterium sp. S2-37]